MFLNIEVSLADDKCLKASGVPNARSAKFLGFSGAASNAAATAAPNGAIGAGRRATCASTALRQAEERLTAKTFRRTTDEALGLAPFLLE
jgi:hypothetical protein